MNSSAREDIKEGGGKMNRGGRKGKYFLLGVSLMGLTMALGCTAAQQSVLKSSSVTIAPVGVELVGVERLNDVAKPPFQRTDTLVFRGNFKLVNPNPVPVRVEDLNFEVKVEDGTPQKTIILTGSMPPCFLPARGEMMWSHSEPYIYGGVLGSYMIRGMGGEEGVKGATQKLDELWQDLGADKRKFFVEGDITASLPDSPDSGVARQKFSTEFTMPKL